MDRDGKCKERSVPIWECGDTCGCPPECLNRVIQRGRSSDTKIDLFKTTNKGWGVRARVNLSAGTYLGIYSGELVTDHESERRGHLYSDIGRTYLFDLDGYQIRHPPPIDQLRKVDPRLADLAERTRQKVLDMELTDDDGFNAYCGAFSTIDLSEHGVMRVEVRFVTDSTVDAFHFGVSQFRDLKASRSANHNHSCLRTECEYLHYMDCDDCADQAVYSLFREQSLCVDYLQLLE